MAVPAQRAGRAVRPTRPTDLHREVEHGVIVATEAPRGRQRVRQLEHPPLPPTLGGVWLPLHPTQPSGHIAVDDYRAFLPMKREPRSRRVGAHSGQRLQALRTFGRSPASRSDHASTFVQQRPAPVESEPVRQISDRFRSSLDENPRCGVETAEVIEYALCLPGARALEERFRHERQPRVGRGTP